jgi:hypothetical protein
MIVPSGSNELLPFRTTATPTDPDKLGPAFDTGGRFPPGSEVDVLDDVDVDVEVPWTVVVVRLVEVVLLVLVEVVVGGGNVVAFTTGEYVGE